MLEKSNYSLYLAIFFLILGCSKSKKDSSPESIAVESKKANEFFDKVFNEYVDRSPIYQTYLGIKKDYGKLDDISPENEEKELFEIRETADCTKGETDLRFGQIPRIFYFPV